MIDLLDHIGNFGQNMNPRLDEFNEDEEEGDNDFLDDLDED